MSNPVKAIGLTLSFLLILGCTNPRVSDEQRLEGLQADLANLKQKLTLPGISAAVVKGDSIIWQGGLGYADLYHEVPASQQTIYHIASITKTFTAVICMQMVEEGLLSLDDPVSKYGVEIESPQPVLVRHLLSNTSGGVPGEQFEYNSYRFGMLEQILVEVGGESFSTALKRRILDPLGMDHTFPNIFDTLAFRQRELIGGIDLSDIMTGYMLDSAYTQRATTLESGFGTAAGLMSTVGDLATYSRALDQGLLLLDDARDIMFTPAVSSTGTVLPYALGWFISEFNGYTLQWHYGHWYTNSSILIRVPEKQLTFVLLANSELLSSAAVNIGDGNILHSPGARIFLNHFLLEEPIDPIEYDRPFIELYGLFNSTKDGELAEFYRQELLGRTQMELVLGREAEADLLWTVYNAVYLPDAQSFLDSSQILAVLDSVGNNADSEQSFWLQEAGNIRVVAVGEGEAGYGMYDYAEITETQYGGDTMWYMSYKRTQHAGGALKNRVVDTNLYLEPGEYVIHYRTDNTHAFNRWNAEPPEIPFYGVAILKPEK